MKESKPYDLHMGQEGRKGDSMCYRYGNPDHLADKHRHHCHQCGKLDHIRSVCQRRRGIPQEGRTHPNLGL